LDEGERKYQVAFSAAFGPPYRRCRDYQDRNNLPADGDACIEEARPAFEKVKHEGLLEPAIRALLPIPIAWLLAYIVVWTVRRIRRGFQPST
jgi:hypothetical protein